MSNDLARALWKARTEGGLVSVALKIGIDEYSRRPRDYVNVN